MAEEADDRCVRDQLKVLTGLKLPGFNWNANNMRMEFDIFWQTLKFVLEGMEIPMDKWYLYILQQLGQRGDDTMDYKHRSHSQPQGPPCNHQGIQERLRVGRNILDVPKPLSQQ